MKKNNLADTIFIKKGPFNHYLLIMRTTIILLFTVVFCAMAEQENIRNTVSKDYLSNIAPQQARKKITGSVVDAKGETIIGANIIEVGTSSNGTVTDFDGNFSLEVQNNAVIRVSYIGYIDQEIKTAGKTTFKIVLKEDTKTLDEVVVVGYGSQRKVDLTGSISSVKGEDISKASAPNLSAALGGKVTGVMTSQTSGQPGLDNADFQIRGVSTTGDNSPLIIVDGVERPFTRIDPKTIESVTVLKDAASTAVYGARAANGVLLITTKRGKEGKAKINYTGQYGIQSQTRKVELMNVAQYAKYINEAKQNDGDVPVFTKEFIEKAQRGEVPSYNWLDAVLNNSAPIKKHNFSVTGGTKDVNYYVSYGYLDQQGLYSSSKYKQNNLRSNLDIAVTDRLDMNVSLGGRIEDRNSSPSPDQKIYQGALFGRPNLSPFLDKEVEKGALGHNGQSGNSVGDAERSGYDNDLRYIFQSNISMEYQIPGIEGLIAKGLFSFDFTARKRKIFKYPYTYYVFNESSNDYQPSNGGASSTSLDERRWLDKDQTLQLSLNYSKNINDHNIAALALFEQVETNSNYLNAFRNDFITKSIDELFAGGTARWSNTGNSKETARRGYIGRIDYVYKGKYLFQANMRIDQSFNFPKNGRTGVFPAFSAGWRLSEESFMKKFDIISNMKLRASWGQVGNDRVPQFQFLSNYEFNGGVVIGSNWNPGIGTTGIANPNITWERATTTNIGVDLGLMNNRWTVEFDYFTKRTKDILQPNTGIIPGTFGASIPDENIGIVDSWGSEATIGYNNKIGDLMLNVSANYSWFDNKAIFVSEPKDILPAIAQTGRPLKQRYGFLSDGLFRTKEEIDNAPIQFSEQIHKSLQPGDIRYKDINGRDENGNLTGKPDGKIDADDRTLIGSSGTPNLMFGFNISLGYKGFDFTANFQGASHFSRFIRPIPFERDGNTYVELIDSWRPGNENAKYPRLSASDLPPNSDVDSDFWVTEVSYLRLRNVELGYNFDFLSDTYSKIGIDNLRLFISGNNLLTLSNLKWRDPEGPSGANPFYPQVKIISFGIDLNF